MDRPSPILSCGPSAPQPSGGSQRANRPSHELGMAPDNRHWSLQWRSGLSLDKQNAGGSALPSGGSAISALACHLHLAPLGHLPITPTPNRRRGP